MARLHTCRRVLAIAVIVVAGAWLSLGGADAKAEQGDSCVREFFAISLSQYGLTPIEVVEAINADSDPTFQVANVADLRDRVARGELGIFDTAGVFHNCT